jgi:hypothetical protein
MQQGKQNEGEGENAAARCKPRARIDDRREWGKLVHGACDVACRGVRYTKRPVRTRTPETINSS